MRTVTRMVLLAVGLVLAGGCAGALITGSGEVATETRELADFDRLEVSEAFDVRVSEGEAGAVRLRVDEAALDRVVAEVEGETLRIGLRPGVRFTLRDVVLEADVTVPDLRAVSARDASSVTLAETLEADALEASLSGASSLEGDVAVDSLTATLSGASTLRLGGSARTGRLEGSGASDLALAGLEFAELDVRLSGASVGRVDVADELAVELSGSSDLTYRGAPRIASQSVTGASSLGSAE